MGENPEAAESERPGAARRPLPGWKKALLGLSAALILAGGGLFAYGKARGGADGGRSERSVAANPKSAEGGRGSAPAGETSFLPGGEAEGIRRGDEDDSGGAVGPFAWARTPEGWSLPLLSGGFSFFLGFCIGYAVRTFLRVVAVVIGLVLLALFGLHYIGVIPSVNWAAFETYFQGIAGSSQGHAGQFWRFIAGSVPSASLAAAGLFTGFKKN